MSLQELASRYEKLSSQLSEQYYNQYAGLTYNREQKEKLAQDYGETWWRKPEAGEFIRQLAQTRGEFDIKAWKLNPDAYLGEQKFLSLLK